jgi:hypothetical protein
MCPVPGWLQGGNARSGGGLIAASAAQVSIRFRSGFDQVSMAIETSSRPDRNLIET